MTIADQSKIDPSLNNGQIISNGNKNIKPENIVNQQQQKTQINFFDSLKTQATAAAIFMGTLPILVVSLIVLYNMDIKLTEEIVQEQSHISENVALKFSQFLQERYQESILLSEHPIFTNADLYQNTTLAEKKAILDSFQKNIGFYDSIVFFDLNGNPLFQSDSDRPFQGNYGDRSYFQETKNTGKIALNDLKISKSSGQLSLEYAIPIKQNGRTFAIIRSRIPGNNLIADMSGYVTEKHDWYLINNDAEIIASNQKELINQGAEGIVPSLLTRKDKKKIFSGEYTNTLKNNEDQLVTYSPVGQIENIPDFNSAVIVTKNAEEAFAIYIVLGTILVYGTIITSLLAILIAIYLGNKATKPILKTAKAVEEIGQGKLDTRINVNSKNELGILASNINQMASRLENFVNAQIKSVEQVQLLAEISGVKVENEESLATIFAQSLTQARELLKTDRIVIYRFNPDWTGYIISESVGKGWTPAKNQKIEDACIPQELLEEYKQDRVVATNDVFNAAFHPNHLDLMKRLQIKANLVVPIVEQDELYGLLIAHHCQTIHEWELSEINFMKELARELSSVLARLSYIKQIQQSQAEAEKLALEQGKIKNRLQQRALELLMEVEPISQGNLTIRATVSEDEIGTIADSYNATIENLRKIVNQVQSVSSVVADSASDNEFLVQDLTAQIQEQTKDMNNALARIETMSQSIANVAYNASKAEEAVQEASLTVATGDRAMNLTVEGILAIRETVAETAKKVKRLGESSQKISQVVTLIDSFTEQTNLLALNASIEAANAGEEGRGFAVVAEEVRNLAKQSAEATAEITMLVEEIQSETNEVVAAMETGTAQVITGTRLVDEAKQSLNQIKSVSGRIDDLVRAIASATIEQTQDSTAASQTIDKIATGTQKNSELVEKLSNSFQELTSLAQELKTSVETFKVS